MAPPTVRRALKGLHEAGLIRRIGTLRACVQVAAVRPGVVVICDDRGTVRGVEAPGLPESLHDRPAAGALAEVRRTIEVHGCCGDCAEDRA